MPSFVFAENQGEGQGLEILPKAAQKLQQQHIKVKYILIGEGRAKTDLISMINNLSVNDYFIFIDRQPAEVIPYYLAKFDVGLVILNDDEIFSRTIPAKLQSLMASGMPILLSANGEVQEIIRKADNGLIGDAGNINQFVSNVIKFSSLSKEKMNSMSQKSLNYNKKYFDKNELMDKLVQTFEEEFDCLQIKHY